MKLKATKKEELVDNYKLFLKIADSLNLYDHRFSEEDQCGGFRCFKNLCHYTGTFPEKYDEITYEEYESLSFMLAGIHPSIRKTTFEAAQVFKKLVKNNQHGKKKN